MREKRKSSFVPLVLGINAISPLGNHDISSYSLLTYHRIHFKPINNFYNTFPSPKEILKEKFNQEKWNRQNTQQESPVVKINEKGNQHK